MNKICVCCNCGELVELERYSNLPRVSSDSKPYRSGGKIAQCNVCGLVQKIIDNNFLDEITEIYSKYDMYQGDVADQPIFINGLELTRSNILVSNLIKEFNLPKNGRLLEIGAGKGAFINEFLKYLPGWKVNSLEYDNKYIDHLVKYNNFEKNYVGVDNLEGVEFDLIVAIHTIEHLIDPPMYLRAAKKVLKDDGYMFFQVPDAANSSFDIAIADHVSHFTQHSFEKLLLTVGLPSEVKVIIPKEITAYYGKNTETKLLVNSDFDIVQNLDYLNRIGNFVKNYPSDYLVGIYGTTIAANWLSNQSRMIDFYVDDDKNKLGKILNGKEIYEAKNIPTGSHVLLPFSRLTNNAIIKRLTDITQLKNIKLIPLE